VAGPAPEKVDDLMLFGQFIGDWAFDVISARVAAPNSRGRIKSAWSG
jgi:hypothetical protein